MVAEKTIHWPFVKRKMDLTYISATKGAEGWRSTWIQTFNWMRTCVSCKRGTVKNSATTETWHSLNVPAHWDVQTSYVQLCPVPADTELYVQKITNSLQVTKRNYRMYGCGRPTNKGFDIKTKGLSTNWQFHGSRENNPLTICKEEDGFDLHFSNKGSWGVALYFSAEAKYTGRFAHTTTEGGKQIMIDRESIWLWNETEQGTSNATSERVHNDLQIR